MEIIHRFTIDRCVKIQVDELNLLPKMYRTVDISHDHMSGLHERGWRGECARGNTENSRSDDRQQMDYDETDILDWVLYCEMSVNERAKFDRRC
jgi:hypothetical protein